MKQFFSSDFKLGILGGGQLGKMLLQVTNSWGVNVAVLDPNDHCPSASICSEFTQGDFTNYDDVMEFGKKASVLTIEIENVNTDALEELEKSGKIIHPSPAVIKTIQDKGLQKEFYRDNNIPTSDFQRFNNADEVKTAYQNGDLTIPFVQKSCREGYDGKGVKVVNSPQDLEELLNGNCIVETLVPIKKELSVIVARNGNGEVHCFPPTEMEFNPKANLVEFLFAPADIDEEIAQTAKNIAIQVSEAFNLQGIMAVEFFLTQDDEVLVNEAAPRPHNSGHHTIEANITSQYEQHLRAILNLPLGSTSQLNPAVMINLLGEDGYSGVAQYHGVEDTMKIEGAKLHIYGKKETKSFRKMGHVTVLDNDLNSAKEKARKIKDILKIKA